MSNFVSYHALSSSFRNFSLALSSVSVPCSVSKAIQQLQWRNIMEEEMRVLERNKTWELVDLPKGKKLVGYKWEFTIKYKSNGTVERYKALLVAKWYTQSYGILYQETFAHLANMNSVRVLISLAANQEWPLLQFDVKNVFLNGHLEKEIYMDTPPRFKIPNAINSCYS